jgi:hypothetical protein
MENILTGEPSTTVLLKQRDSRKDALRVEKSVPIPNAENRRTHF